MKPAKKRLFKKEEKDLVKTDNSTLDQQVKQLI